MMKYIIGTDEVGRGCLAGPVVAASVIVDLTEYESMLNLLKNLGITDSKKISTKKRQNILNELNISNLKVNQNIAIPNTCMKYAIYSVNSNIIDDINILQSTFLAMNNSLILLSKDQSNIKWLVDGDKSPNKNFKGTVETIIKGDLKNEIIGLASIIAKEYRDKLMISLHSEYPQYDFASNKGYGSKKHRDAIKSFGMIQNIHRESFKLKS